MNKNNDFDNGLDFEEDDDKSDEDISSSQSKEESQNSLSTLILKKSFKLVKTPKKKENLETKSKTEKKEKTIKRNKSHIRINLNTKDQNKRYIITAIELEELTEDVNKTTKKVINCNLLDLISNTKTEPHQKKTEKIDKDVDFNNPIKIPKHREKSGIRIKRLRHSFSFFLKEQMEYVNAKFPHLVPKEKLKYLAKKWNELKDRSKYIEMMNKDRERYHKEKEELKKATKK